jgi:hypothetical protein
VKRSLDYFQDSDGAVSTTLLTKRCEHYEIRRRGTNDDDYHILMCPSYIS